VVKDEKTPAQQLLAPEKPQKPQQQTAPEAVQPTLLSSATFLSLLVLS
jgi:hypothetical protein